MRYYPPLGPMRRHALAFGVACLLAAASFSPTLASAPGATPQEAAPDTVALRVQSGLEAAARTAAVTGALLTADLVVRRVAEATQNGAADDVAGRAKWLGTWRSSAPVYLLGGAALGFALEGTDGLEKLLAVAVGALAGSTANEIVNVGFGRHRPRHDRGSLAFRPLRGHASFPSGHTAYVFAMAAAVDEVTEGTLPAALAYGAATLTGLSRIYHDSHWFSDVAVGAAVGLTVSRLATRETLRRLDGDPAEEPSRAENRSGGPILLAGPGYVGLQLRF